VLSLAVSHTALIRPSDLNDPRLTWFVQQLKSIEKQTACPLIDLHDTPGIELFNGDEENTQKLLESFFQILFVLGAGSDDGVMKGDRFALIYEPKAVRDADGNIVDLIPGSANLLEAIEVKKEVTYCRMQSFSYGSAFENFQVALDKLGGADDDVIDEGQYKRLLLSLFGHRALRIARKESDAESTVNKLYNRVLDEKDGTIGRERALRDLLVGSREFLEIYPSSLLSDRVAFHEAWSTMQLGRYEESEHLFEQFLKKFPFSVSLNGAREHLEEIRLRIRLHESGKTPEVQVELAKNLLQSESNFVEGTTLAIEAYKSKPEVLGRMGSVVRFILTGKVIFHELLGMDIEAPEAMKDLLMKYRKDTELRKEIDAKIEESAGPELAGLLVRLLKTTSED
jgi:hypothetical protein